MDTGLGKCEEELDYIIRDVFDDISSDRYFAEAFFVYFKDRIVKHSFSSTALYLSDEEKSLQYAGTNTVEPLVEYLLLIDRNESKVTKRHYAEKGAVFSVVQPSLQVLPDQERNYYTTGAQTFYGVVASHSEHAESAFFFDFLSESAKLLVDGLEEVFAAIKENGTAIRRRRYENSLLLYQMTPTGEESKGYARQLISLGRSLGVPEDEFPLRNEDYRLLFE